MTSSQSSKNVPLNRQTLSAALQLPGLDAWKSTLDSTELNRPAQRPAELPGTGRQAAVMALAYPVADQVQLAVIRRHQQLTHHAGQIALAGGRQEPNESLQTTAIRETHEELGVLLRQDDVLGSLRQVYIPPSDFTLLPFVGWLDQRPTFKLCPDEVEEVIEVPFQVLLDPASEAVRKVTLASGDTMEVPCFVHQQNVIWGATALVISEFIERIQRLGS